MNRSYYCHHCDRGYNTQNAQHHNCEGQNCDACCRTNNTCPNFATWVKPSVYCPDCNSWFYGQDCIQAHKVKTKKKREKSICETWKTCHLCCAGYAVNPKKPHVVCRNCGELQHVNHRCYIQPIREKKQKQQTLEVEEEEEEEEEEDLLEERHEEERQ